jgi:hypothetical protein
LFKKIELVLPQKEEGDIEAAKERGEGRGKSVRTVCHGRHFSDLPCGEITIEGNSTLKHCTCTTATNKKPKDKNGLKKKE